MVPAFCARFAQVYPHGVVADGIGIGEIAVQAGRRLTADHGVGAVVVYVKGLQDVLLGAYVVVLVDVEGNHVAGGHPLAVFFLLVYCLGQHLLHEIHGTHELAVVVVVVLGYFVGMVVILPVSQFRCHVLQVVHVFLDTGVVGVGHFFVPEGAGQVLEPLYIVEGLRLGIPFCDGGTEQHICGTGEARLPCKLLCFTHILITFVVYLVRIVLRSGCRRYTQQNKKIQITQFFHILKYN